MSESTLMIIHDTVAKTNHSSESAVMNKLSFEDRSVHDWYRFVLSFPPHLVREYIRRFELTENSCVLDPFCGTGTTLVECKKNGIPSIGVEAHPMMCFASQVKVNWNPNPDGLMKHARVIAKRVMTDLEKVGIDDIPCFQSNVALSEDRLKSLNSEQMKLLLHDSISPLPLHKSLILIDTLNECHEECYYGHETLAMAKAIVNNISNLHFGPEVGVGMKKDDAPVISPWLSNICDMTRDIRDLARNINTSSVVHHADSRQIMTLIEEKSVDAVITSPPYPNEKDYTRTTRLESVLLGFIHDKTELRKYKQSLMRSNTRNVYKGDEDDVWVANFPEIQRIADEIEAKRIALEKTSGFERLYAKVTKLYFGGMTRHLAELRRILRPGAKLAYVVGDQASYLQVMIHTGNLLADIGASLGYEVVGIDLFRTRQATATRKKLREEVVLLRWPG